MQPGNHNQRAGLYQQRWDDREGTLREGLTVIHLGRDTVKISMRNSGPRCLLFGRLACAWKRCCVVVSSNSHGRKISLGGDGECTRYSWYGKRIFFLMFFERNLLTVPTAPKLAISQIRSTMFSAPVPGGAGAGARNSSGTYYLSSEIQRPPDDHRPPLNPRVPTSRKTSDTNPSESNPAEQLLHCHLLTSSLISIRTTDPEALTQPPPQLGRS